MLSIFYRCSKFCLDGIFELIETAYLKVLPNREIAEIKAPFPHSEAIYLETIADKTSDKVWKINPDKILIAYEKRTIG
ncbi:MAG: hypothetical protein NUV44_06070 [Candidatus Scalindua sp.]|nr:hypothetical protein [Candidatus Scalindua sp.]